MTIQEFNTLSHTDIFIALERCCGSKQWIESMIHLRPFQSHDVLFNEADRIWKSLPEQDWKEAFTHHPKIGDVENLRSKFASTSMWAEGEQSGVQSAPEEILNHLAEGNRAYEKKFGFIFIVCATGKSADEMLSLLKRRLSNDPKSEILIAAEEQRKITRLRLEKLFS